jgi:rubredoxin
MASYQRVYINFTGGIISPGLLKSLMEIAAVCRISEVRFGRRQQLIIDVPVKFFPEFEHACLQLNISFIKEKNSYPNIVSSYPATGIFNGETWLTEGVYKDVFALFQHTPRYKINVVDSTQSFIPFFTGHINWIASTSVHHWHLYVRFPNTEYLWHCPQLIYTNDLAEVSKQVELYFEKHVTPDGNLLYQQLQSAYRFMDKLAAPELVLPEFTLPYYEGFNRMGAYYWLGIYRRDEYFPVAFLNDIASLTLQQKIGQLYATTWKTIIIKNINPSNRKPWDIMLAKHRINVRHAANELNWQVEDNTEDGLVVKRHVIRYFDKEDVRTYGLSFAVETKPAASVFGSVIIRRIQKKNPHNLRSIDRFDILYRKDFNPNAGELMRFRENVEKEHIGVYLVSLYKLFYEEKQRYHEALIESQLLTHSAAETKREVYQCKHCETVYHAEDDAVAFEELSDSYCCPLCEAPKSDYLLVEIE